MAKRGVVGIPNIIKFEKFSKIILRKFSNLGKLIGWVDGYFRNSRLEGCKGVGRFNIFRKWIPEAYTAGKERLEMSFYIRLRNKIVVRTPWSTKWNEVFLKGIDDCVFVYEFICYTSIPFKIWNKVSVCLSTTEMIFFLIVLFGEYQSFPF